MNEQRVSTVPAIPWPLRQLGRFLISALGGAAVALVATALPRQTRIIFGLDVFLGDIRRIDFLHAHLRALARATADGYPVRSYYCWSLLDNFEWLQGYSQRFGLVYVDFEHGQRRTIKESGRWYAEVAATNRLPASTAL